MVKIDASEYETNWLTDSPEKEGQPNGDEEAAGSDSTPTEENQTEQAAKALASALEDVTKEWIPYRGNRGGVGWQNTEDEDDIRYVDEAPGEVADGFEFIGGEVNSRSPPPDTVSFGEESGTAGPHTEEGSLTNRIAEIQNGSGAGWEKVQSASDTLEESIGARTVSLAKVSDEAALDTAQIVATLHDHNPEIIEPSFMFVRPPKERPKAAGAYDWESNRVEVHPEDGYNNSKRKEYYSNYNKSSGHPYGTLIHELGHLAHQQQMELAEDVSGDAWESTIDEGIDDVEATLPDDKKIHDLRNEVSSYAGTNPLEFVAEVWTGALTGHEYPDWVWDVYTEFSGPEPPDVTFSYEIDGRYARKNENELPHDLSAEADVVWQSFEEWRNEDTPTDALERALDSTFEKDQWIPYEGPEGGEGWQNASDPEDVRYDLDEPPGEVAEGYEDIAEDWGSGPEDDLPEGRTMTEGELDIRGTGLNAVKDAFRHASDNGSNADLKRAMEMQDFRPSDISDNYWVGTHDRQTVVAEVYEYDGELVYEGMEDFTRWMDSKFGSWDSDEEITDYLDQTYEESHEEEFWRGDDAYHATGPKTAAQIILDGEIERRAETRGMGNSGVGSAVFTSMRSGDWMDVYGAVQFEIDVQAMKEDGYQPTVEPEPPVADAKNEEMFARKMGVFNHRAHIPHDMSQDTAVIYGEIPTKYLSLNADEETLNDVEGHINHLEEEGEIDGEQAEEARQWVENQRGTSKSYEGESPDTGRIYVRSEELDVGEKKTDERGATYYRVHKQWIPYEGPEGGEGWQNTQDPDDIRYGLDEPPGEVAEGYEEQAEGWGNSDGGEEDGGSELGNFLDELGHTEAKETIEQDIHSVAADTDTDPEEVAGRLHDRLEQRQDRIGNLDQANTEQISGLANSMLENIGEEIVEERNRDELTEAVEGYDKLTSTKVTNHYIDSAVEQVQESTDWGRDELRQDLLSHLEEEGVDPEIALDEDEGLEQWAEAKIQEAEEGADAPSDVPDGWGKPEEVTFGEWTEFEQGDAQFLEHGDRVTGTRNGEEFEGTVRHTPEDGLVGIELDEGHVQTVETWDIDQYRSQDRDLDETRDELRDHFSNISQHNQSLQEYTGQAHREINGHMRDTAKEVDADSKGKLEHAIMATADADTARVISDVQAATKQSLPREMNVARGIDVDAGSFMDRAEEAMERGGSLMDEGFQSATIDRDVAEGFGNVTLDIQTDHGVYARAASEFAGEDEVLLPAGTQYEVKEVDRENNTVSVEARGGFRFNADVGHVRELIHEDGMSYEEAMEYVR